MNVIVILICVFAPLGILWLTYKSVLLRKVGSIIIAYVIGCTLGLTGLIPDTEEMHAVQTTMSTNTTTFYAGLNTLMETLRWESPMLT